jgi:two-component system nitrogen regulation response regulator GlnG
MQRSENVSHRSSSLKRSEISLEADVTTRDPWEDGLIEEIEQLLAEGSQTMVEEVHERVDRVLFELVLAETGGNISEASLRLGISRPTLRTRIKQLRLNT